LGQRTQILLIQFTYFSFYPWQLCYSLYEFYILRILPQLSASTVLPSALKFIWKIMRRFMARHRNRIWMKSLSSSIIICIFLYIIIRCLSFDFPMSWREELSFFGKILFTGCSLIVFSATGSAFMYKTFLKIKRDKKAT
jgi:hypothetical protein